MTYQILFCFFALFNNTSHAFTPAPFTPNVVDTTKTLTASEIQQINQSIENLKQKNIHAAVYFSQPLADSSIESAAHKTFNQWKLGTDAADNGLLFMFVLNQRKARIEVGYGLEGDITDLHAKALLDEVILPDFKKQEYAAGLLRGLNMIYQRDFSELPKAPNTFTMTDPGNFGFWCWGFWVILLLICYFVLTQQKTGAKLITGFLIINPGLFIFFLSEPLYNYLSNYDTFGADLLSLVSMSVLVYALYLLPFIFGFLAGKINQNIKNPDIRKSIFQYISAKLSVGTYISFFFACVFYKLFIGSARDDFPIGDAIPLSIVGLVIAFIAAQQALVLALPSFYLKDKARKRLRRIQRRVTGTRDIFGKSYTYQHSYSSSSSSSSSSSWSSSSGGGSSGGGGASSSW